MGKSPSRMPVQKVTIGALAGAFTTIGVGLLRSGFHIDVPADVASAMTIVFTFVASYLTPPEFQEGGTAAGGSTTSAGQGSVTQALLVTGQPVHLAFAEKARNGSQRTEAPV
jgi:hypothetical protein